MVEDMVTTRQDGQDAATQHFTPKAKLPRNDAHFPLSTPRRMRPPSITSVTEIVGITRPALEDKLTLRIKGSEVMENVQAEADSQQHGQSSANASSEASKFSLLDLPLEVQGKVLDYIFGDLHAIASNATYSDGKSLSSSMRHPRRKAVSDLALVSETWRELVQERIYRHIKIKGTKAGIKESQDYFSQHMHLSDHVRHIEFWVPVWGDKASLDRTFDFDHVPLGRNGYHQLANPGNAGLDAMTANDLLGFNFKLSTYSATLLEIFAHTHAFFPQARIFTLEGGHCKNSNMIRHFPDQLFPSRDRALAVLPNIRTFAMRGAWNIMRHYGQWLTIASALPNIEEWHCGYASPRPEAYNTIDSILYDLPHQLRHVTISLDGMYCKEMPVLGSTVPVSHTPHLCTQLGRIVPMLESLSYTGKVCSHFWTEATKAVSSNITPRLQALEVVVKSCCRRQILIMDPETGLEMLTDEPSSLLADGTGITNLAFIRAFERLTVSTVSSLSTFSALEHIRIRYIDLDSPCALLNPYFQLRHGVCYGLWNEEILDLLPKVRPGLAYESLGDGINTGKSVLESGSGVGLLYPKRKPRSIKASSYRLLAEARVQAM